MKLKLSYYEDEIIYFDKRSGNVEVRFKFGFSYGDLAKSLERMKLVIESVNDLYISDQPKRSKREETWCGSDDSLCARHMQWPWCEKHRHPNDAKLCGALNTDDKLVKEVQ